MNVQPLIKWFGIELDVVSAKETVVCIAGGFIAIFIMVAITQYTGATMLVASMGASAVLLFAVPHAQLAQPWPVLAGHVLPAVIGVACARFIPNIPLAAGCAVGLSIGVTHQLKCIHPPGGATGLIAVMGGPGVHALGYTFALYPVLLNALTIIAVAVMFNFAFKWRRYPASLNRGPKVPARAPEISHEEIVAAVRSIDSFVDITETDLIRLCQILSPTPAEKKQPSLKISKSARWR